MFLRRSTLRSPQFAKKKKKQFWARFGVFIFAVLILIAAPAVLSHMNFVKISEVDIRGVNAMSRDALSEYIDGKISKNFLWVFSMKNVVLYPRKKTEKSLIKDFPEIDKVDISMKGLNAISVSILERSPNAVWCTGDMPAQGDIKQDCYLIDERGLLFAQAPHFSGNVYSRFYGLVDEQNPIGSEYVGSDQYKELKTFSKNLSDAGLNISGIYLNNEDGRIFLESGGVILFSRSNSLESTFGQVDLLLKDRLTVQDKEVFLNEVEYIDARILNKIFFKMRAQN